MGCGCGDYCRGYGGDHLKYRLGFERPLLGLARIGVGMGVRPYTGLDPEPKV